ncbi:MAG: N-acetyl-gamma-glutamyl-phosphate reductase [Actinomycetota bacterium]
MIRVVVLGASGFAGAELLRLLEGHSEIEVVAAGAGSQAGRPVAEHYPSLTALKTMRFSSTAEALGTPADLVFCSLPHSSSMKHFTGDEPFKIVDLGGDHRLRDPEVYRHWFGEPHSNPGGLNAWVYGLTERSRQAIAGARFVANPGCYPTAALLALAPLLEAGVIEPGGIHIDAISGVSGAGRAGGEGFDFCSVNENLSPYRVTGHKHIAEIEQELSAAAGLPVTVGFVPHLAPITRGLLATCSARAIGNADPLEVLHAAYARERFVRVLDAGLPATKRVNGTNNAELFATKDARTGTVLAFCSIDNLGKGAAGQALQNANLMLGLPEHTGLQGLPCLP